MAKELKILIGCPTSEHKNYCLKEYVEGVNNIDYENKKLVLVDNSRDEIYYDIITKEYKVECVKLKYVDGIRKRIAQSREVLRKMALDEGYDYFGKEFRII